MTFHRTKCNPLDFAVWMQERSDFAPDCYEGDGRHNNEIFVFRRKFEKLNEREAARTFVQMGLD